MENELFPQNLGKDSALGRATTFEPVHQQPTLGKHIPCQEEFNQ
jgi:hypothetical protein